MKETSNTTKGTTTSSGDTTVVQKISQLPRFFVHFRRRGAGLIISKDPFFRGQFGFDWLRDEYIYDIDTVHILNKPAALFAGDFASKLIEQYTHFDGKPIKEISDILTYGDDPYIPSWLSLQEGKEANLYLHIDLATTERHSLSAKNNINLVFECDSSIVIIATKNQSNTTQPLTIALKDAIGSLTPIEKNFSSSKQDLKSKNFKRYETKFEIKIKALKSFDAPKFVKVKAKEGNKESNVGLLILYPNNKILETNLQVIYFSTTSIPPTLPADFQKAVNENFFAQALIKPTFEQPINIDVNYELKKLQSSGMGLSNRKNKEKLTKFLQTYPANKEIDDKNNQKFYTEVIDIIKMIRPDIEINNRTPIDGTTYIIVVEHRIKKIIGYTGGFALVSSSCSGGICYHTGNTLFITQEPSGAKQEPDTKLINLIHELGHVFGLPHIFRGNSEKVDLCIKHQESNKHPDFVSACNSYSLAYHENDALNKFYQGYTDNVMDYGHSVIEDTTSQSFFGSKSSQYAFYRLALTKWQWEILRNDSNVITPN